MEVDINHSKIPGVELIPPHMRDAVFLYMFHGIKPGDFLTAALADTLVGAFSRADETNAKNMGNWVLWLYNECPSQLRGSYEAVDAWVEHHRKLRASIAELDGEYYGA